MAFFIGKLVLLGGAALVGSIVIEKGRLPTVTESVSGAFKVLRTLNGGDSGTSKSKSDNAAVTREIKNLQHQLQFLDSNRQIVVVSSNSSGSTKYSVIIVVLVVGYGYVWWKGWKLSDMMFATKRSLADACGSVSKQLETVYVAIDKTRRHLNSRIDNAEGKIDEVANLSAATKDDINEVRGDLGFLGTNVKTVRDTIITLETRFISLEGKQGEAVSNIGQLVNIVRNIETGNRPIEGVSRTTSVPALENSQGGPVRTLSLPPASPMGSSTPSPSNRASQAHGTVPNGVEIVELSSQNSAPPMESSSFLGMGSSGRPTNVLRRKLSIHPTAKLSFNT